MLEALLKILEGLIGMSDADSSSPFALTVLEAIIKLIAPEISLITLSLVVRKASLALEAATDPNTLWLEIYAALDEALDGRGIKVIE